MIMWERDGKGEGEGRGDKRGGRGEVRKKSVLDGKDKERLREGEGKKMEGWRGVCVREREEKEFVLARERRRGNVCE